MADDRLDLLDYYTLLGVEDDAPVDAIKQAFRRFAKAYHPDRHAGQSPAKVRRATQIYRRGSEAMQVLTDPVLRRAYDSLLERGQLRMTPELRDRAKRGRL